MRIWLENLLEFVGEAAIFAIGWAVAVLVFLGILGGAILFGAYLLS